MGSAVPFSEACFAPPSGCTWMYTLGLRAAGLRSAMGGELGRRPVPGGPTPQTATASHRGLFVPGGENHRRIERTPQSESRFFSELALDTAAFPNFARISSSAASRCLFFFD